MEQILRKNKFSGTSFLNTLKILFQDGADIYLIHSAWNTYFDKHFQDYQEAVKKIQFVDRGYISMTKKEVIQSIVNRHKI